MKLKQNIVTARKVAGKKMSQGAVSSWPAPWENSRPQLVRGSWTPRPRNDRELSTMMLVGISSVT